MTRLLGSLSSRWAMPVLYRLLVTERPMRFTELKHAIGRIAQKELTRTLREFERVGLVLRRAYREAPPRVEYELTPLGQSLRGPLLALGDWAAEHAHELGAAALHVESSGSDGADAESPDSERRRATGR